MKVARPLIAKRFTTPFTVAALWTATVGVSEAQYTVTLLPSAGLNFSQAFAMSNGTVVGYGRGTATGNEYHALMWQGASGNFEDLNPAGYSHSQIRAISGNNFGGSAFSTAAAKEHAAIWTGSGSQTTDLHPSGFLNSGILGMSDTHQVGFVTAGNPNEYPYASIWSGDASSRVDLNPANCDHGSKAFGIDGDAQVGYGVSSIQFAGNLHAFLWHGTAASAVDLNPMGFSTSGAFSIDGHNQGGSGSGPVTGGKSHALLWHDSASVFEDLHPSAAGFESSMITSVAPGMQVGFLSNGSSGTAHAVVWTGTAASAVDLQAFLPSGFTSSSAWGIDRQTGVVVGVAYNSNVSQAVKWTPVAVPEPSTFWAIFSGLTMSIGCRKLARRARP